MVDLIGDIHGHAEALQRLLKQLGYSRHKGVYGHPDRQVIFLGDFIDRGPQIREALQIVRPMIDSGAALAVMGNHELNALAFHTANPQMRGEHLRAHNEKNSHQHAETIRQVPAGELESYLDWFRTLPLWLDLDGLRVVHACWDETRMAKISGPITDEFLHSACLPDGALFEPVEAILKGKEAAVPYPEDARPVFVGHYWLKGSRPELLRRNIACVDWSVAKGGFLCAYRWDGEQELDVRKFVWNAA